MLSQFALHLAAFLIVSTISGWSQATTLVQTTQLVSPAEPIICDGASPYLGRPITEVAPEYPKHALKEKIKGNVVLDLTVSERGKVVFVSVLSGDPELSREAVKAVKKWEYFPDLDNSAERHTKVTVIFIVDDGGKPAIGAEFPPPPITHFCSGDHDVTPPRAIYTPDPSYSEEARRAKAQGVCVLSVVVEPDGLPGDIKIKRGLGHSLDEKAIEAVKRWKFDPAQKNGAPVAVRIKVDVRFRMW